MKHSVVKLLDVAKRCVKTIGMVCCLYLVLALISSFWTIESRKGPSNRAGTCYLVSNGVHVDVIIPVELLNHDIANSLQLEPSVRNVAFGWGEEQFYLTTPHWSDLTMGKTAHALLMPSKSVMHVSTFQYVSSNWISVEIFDIEGLNGYLTASFSINESQQFEKIDCKGYSEMDSFYKAVGNYSCFKTCNSWTNLLLRRSGAKSCLWTPFSFAITRLYE